MLPFVKMHAAGNDYILIDGRGREEDWPALAVAMSHRHFGAGSDGILVAQESSVAPIRMRVFNPDGSEAEMSGNGLRLFAKFVLERGLVSLREGEPLRVETLAGVRTVVPLWEGGRVVRARVGMGRPRFRPEEVPMQVPQGTPVPVVDLPVEVAGRTLRLTCLSMGNPHAVAFLEEPVEQFPLEQVGPRVERHPLFPQRTNFQVVNRVGPDRLRARVWERGAGETLASGTSASAVAVAGRLHGWVGDRVQVDLPGGTLTVEWDGQGEVVLEGPVEEVYEGVWLKPLPQR